MLMKISKVDQVPTLVNKAQPSQRLMLMLNISVCKIVFTKHHFQLGIVILSPVVILKCRRSGSRSVLQRLWQSLKQKKNENEARAVKR